MILSPVLRVLLALALGGSLLAGPVVAAGAARRQAALGLAAPASAVPAELTRLSSAGDAGSVRSPVGLGLALTVVARGLAAGSDKHRAGGAASTAGKRWLRWRRLLLEGG